MKHKLIYVCLFLISMGWFSCTKDERVYSCDKAVDAWVKENLTSIQMMTRNDWLKLGEDVKRAAYIAFTPEQKFIFWKEKLIEVLALNWNEAERKHLELMYKTISENPQWFADDFSKNEVEWEKFEQFTYRWRETAEADFGWDRDNIRPMIASGNKMLNTKGELQINAGTTISLRSSADDCECSGVDSYCGNNHICDASLTCNPSSFGCGTIGLYRCDGMCAISAGVSTIQD